jgi:AraC-like DNA-binding protein/mannose-6-phosphate isomerase-like protein (cupin superfamily)
MFGEKGMDEEESDRYLVFRHRENLHPYRVESLGYDVESAHEVAEPLFKHGVLHAQITEREDYQSKISHSEFHTFTMMIQGKMELTIENEKWDLRQGELAYYPPNAKYQRKGTGKIWWLYINIADTSDWEKLKKRGPFVRQYENSTLLFSLLRSILDAMRTQGASDINLARQNSRALLNLLKHEQLEADNPGLRYHFKLQKLIDDVSRTPEHQWTVEEMASRLHVSKSQLTKLFKREYQKSPLDVVIHHRMEKASDLLLRTNLSLDDVANESGYQNVYSFSRLFSKRIGVSPGRFRRNRS